MERIEFVIVAEIKQYIIGFVKPISLELQKSSCDLVQAQAEANRTKIIISKQRTEAVYSGSNKRAVGIAETVNVTPEKPRSASSSRQKHRADAEAGAVEAYFQRNVFYPYAYHITSKMKQCFPNEVIPILQVFLFHNIDKLDKSVLGSMEQYFDLPCKVSLMQEGEEWKQKIDDHEMNFKTLTQSVATANSEFFPNINYMLTALVTRVLCRV